MEVWPFCTRYWQYLLNMKWLMYGIRFLQLFVSLRCFYPRAFYWKNGLGKLPWKSFISDVHTKIRMISRSIPVITTDSTYGVWGCGLTTGLLYGGSLLCLCFQMTFGVQVWYGGEEFFITSACIHALTHYTSFVLPILFLLKWFYSETGFVISTLHCQIR